MTTMAMETAKRVDSAGVLARAVCLILSRHYLGNNRKVDMQELVDVAGGTLEAKAQQQLTATRKLIDGSELRPCLRVLASAQDGLRRLAIPTHRVFGERTYLIPLANIRKADAMLADLQHELRQRAAELAGRYAAAVEKQREALGPLFKAAQYLRPHEVVHAFGLDWSYVSFAAPENLSTVSAALAEDADRKYQEKLGAAFDEVRQTLRETALRVCRELANKLGEDKSGRPKGVRGTALDDLREFVEGYQALDLTDDAELADVVAALRAVASGTTVEDLKDSEDARAAVLAQAASAVSRLEVLVKPRGISFAGDL